MGCRRDVAVPTNQATDLPHMPSLQGSSNVGHLDHCTDTAPAGIDRLRVSQVWVCDERIAGADRRYGEMIVIVRVCTRNDLGPSALTPRQADSAQWYTASRSCVAG
jgi:hypothetical protein